MTSLISVERLINILTNHPDSNKRQIYSYLRAQGVDGLTLSDINSVLYSNQKYFSWRTVPNGCQRIWRLKSKPREIHTTISPTSPGRSFSDQLNLYPWQRRALLKWRETGYKGVVEAVTGAGKTRMAVVAAAGHLFKKWKVVTIVPTHELMNQWHKEFENHLVRSIKMNVRIGRLGGGKSDTLENYDILIATASSSARYLLLPNSYKGLLIADECHHYGAESWSRALEEGFAHRLGLTATYEREDQGREKYLDPYFGGVVYSLDYEEALSENVIADFKIAFIGSRFSPREQVQYEEADDRASRYRKMLINQYGLPEEPFGTFILEVNKLHKANSGRASKIAGYYLSAFTKRRHIMAAANAKLEKIQQLKTAIKEADRTIVFAQTREAAERVVQLLENEDIAGAVLDSTMDMDERRRVFAGFEEGEHELMAAPRLLDEGIDVPSADLGIVLATCRSRRHLIQRMGRVLRRKADGRTARLAVLFIEGTAEDPRTGAHEDFMDIVADAALETRIFSANDQKGSFISYLSEFH